MTKQQRHEAREKAGISFSIAIPPPGTEGDLLSIGMDFEEALDGKSVHRNAVHIVITRDLAAKLIADIQRKLGRPT